MLTLEQFRASKQWKPDGDPNNGLEGPGFVYAECCYINVCGDEGPYELTIENYGCLDKDLGRLETILYNQWYLTEVAAVEKELWEASND